MFFWRGKGVLQGKGRLVRARVVGQGGATPSLGGGSENRLRVCRVALARGRLEAAPRQSGFGTFALPPDLQPAGGRAGAAIACDENVLRGGDVVEAGVSALEFFPEMALPVNENDPRGGDVSRRRRTSKV